MNPDILNIYASTFTTLKEWDEGIYNYNTDDYMMKLLIIRQRFKEEGLEAEIHLPESESEFPYLDFVRENVLGWFDWNIFDKINSFIVQNQEGFSSQMFESESLEEAINSVVKYLKS